MNHFAAHSDGRMREITAPSTGLYVALILRRALLEIFQDDQTAGPVQQTRPRIQKQTLRVDRLNPTFPRSPLRYVSAEAD